MATATAFFLEEPQFFDHNPSLCALEHVVNGESCSRCGGHGFHLDSGSPAGTNRGDHANQAPSPLRRMRRDVHGDGVNGKGMAQRHEVGRTLRPLDSGEPGDLKHIALAVASGASEVECAGTKTHQSFDARFALGIGLAAHIHHVRVPVGVEVGQLVGLANRHASTPLVQDARSITLLACGLGYVDCMKMPRPGVSARPITPDGVCSLMQSTLSLCWSTRRSGTACMSGPRCCRTGPRSPLCPC